MNLIFKKESTAIILFFVALLMSVGYILQSFPPANGYYVGADEGTYYRQAKKIKEEGIIGFKTLANDYISNPDLQVFPPPERIAHILFASLALSFSDSFFMLSLLSLLFFIIQCIASFYFAKKHWGVTVAVALGILLCFSPLSMGIAKRALSDSGYYLFISLSIFSFIDYLYVQKKQSMIQFVIFFSVCILIKESALFILPYFGLILIIEKYYRKKEIQLSHIALLIGAPIAFCLLSYLLFFGNTISDIFAITNKTNLAKPQDYILNFNSGPWYQYFVDYFLMSPLVSILFLLFIGYFILTNQKTNDPFLFLILLFIYFIFVFAFLPKNIRYAQPLDLIYRIGAVLMVREMYRKMNFNIQIKTQLIIALLAVLVAKDAFAYQSYFVKNNIYDPISFNLLKAENFFSIDANKPSNNVTTPTKKVNPSALALLNQSVIFYNSGKYNECIETSKKAIELEPDYAEAYNNMCCSYNQLKDWVHAIEAGNRALEINPNYQLAKNNVNWATSQLALENK